MLSGVNAIMQLPMQCIMHSSLHREVVSRDIGWPNRRHHHLLARHFVLYMGKVVAAHDKTASLGCPLTSAPCSCTENEYEQAN